MITIHVFHIAVSFSLSGKMPNNLDDFLWSSTYPGFLLVYSKFYDACSYFQVLKLIFWSMLNCTAIQNSYLLDLLKKKDTFCGCSIQRNESTVFQLLCLHSSKLFHSQPFQVLAFRPWQWLFRRPLPYILPAWATGSFSARSPELLQNSLLSNTGTVCSLGKLEVTWARVCVRHPGSSSPCFSSPHSTHSNVIVVITLLYCWGKNYLQVIDKPQRKQQVIINMPWNKMTGR